MFFDIQNASMLKRIAAWILDMILVAICATGFGYLISVGVGYDANYDKLEQKYDYYSDEYGIDLRKISQLDGSDTELLEKYKAASAAMDNDEELKKQYAYVVNLTLVILAGGILLGIAVVEFIIPLILKDGRTPGKMIFSLCLMQNDQTKIKPVFLAVRAFLGIYTIETMVPVLIVVMLLFNTIGVAGTVTICLLLLLQIILLAKTKNNLAIHDALAGTVVVDAKSQKIFDSPEAKEEYRKQYNQ